MTLGSSIASKMPKHGFLIAHFGAVYPDAQCHEGYLWDEDSCDEPGGPLMCGGDIPCPQCNAAEYAEYIRPDDDGGEDAAEQPDAVKIPRDLLEQAATWLEAHAPGGGCIEGSVAADLRALLGKDGEA